MHTSISDVLMDVNSIPRISFLSSPLNNQDMRKIEDVRRNRLGLLITEYGTQAALAAKIGKAPAQLSQWVNASVDSKSKKPRSMDSGTARAIEALTGKPDGWMDQPVPDEAAAQASLLAPVDEGAEAARRAVDEAIAMLEDVLLMLDDDGRDFAALALSKFAKNPTRERDRVIGILAAAIHERPTSPDPSPQPPTRQAKKTKSVAPAAKTHQRAQLVLKIGDGQGRMFSMPMEPLRKVIDNRNASDSERRFHKRIEAAPKAKA